MRILFHLIILSLIISCTNSRKSPSVEEPAAGEPVDTMSKSPIISSRIPHAVKNVEDIKKEYDYVVTKINNNGMDSTSFTYNCHDEKKGTIVYYLDNDDLRMIKHTYYEYSHFSATDSYFVKDSSLFFVYFNRVSWSFDPHGKGVSDTKDDITESRFYIIDNNPVMCLEKKFTIRSSENTSPNMASNEEVVCSSLQPILKEFRLLVKYKSQKKSVSCLEE